VGVSFLKLNLGHFTNSLMLFELAYGCVNSRRRIVMQQSMHLSAVGMVQGRLCSLQFESTNLYLFLTLCNFNFSGLLCYIAIRAYYMNRFFCVFLVKHRIILLFLQYLRSYILLSKLLPDGDFARIQRSSVLLIIIYFCHILVVFC